VTSDTDIFDINGVEDSYVDISLDSPSAPTEEDLGYSTSDVTLFLSEPTGNGSITVDTATPPVSLEYRLFHKDLEYV
jgi:hypothetical protein